MRRLGWGSLDHDWPDYDRPDHDWLGHDWLNHDWLNHDWLNHVWQRLWRLGGVGTLLLLASLTAAAQAQILAVPGGVSTPVPLATEVVFACLSAYLKERGVANERSVANERGVATAPAFAIEDLVLADLVLEDLILASPPPPHVALRVTGSRWDGLRQELQFYLRCAEPQACRPFLATIHLRNEANFARLRALAPGGGPLTRGWDGGDAVSHRVLPRPALLRPALLQPALLQPALLRKALLHQPPLVRAGEHVPLVMAGSGIRIRLPVICLERGVLGQQVRARALDGRKIFHARVAGPGLLTTEVP